MWKVAFVCLGLSLSGGVQAAPSYHVTLLQTPAGASMDGFGLNNNGDVVGGIQETTYQAYLRRADGTYEALGGLGGNRSTATAISDNGIIVGQARTGATAATSLPFIRLGDGPLAPIPLPQGGSNALVQDVNNSSTVIGSYFNAGQVAFRWNAATGFETLQTLDGINPVEVLALNNAGVAVGSSFNFDQTAFRWNTDGSVDVLEKFSAPNQIAHYSSATDILDTGEIAGTIFWETADYALHSAIVVWDNSGAIARMGELAGWNSYSNVHMNNFGDIAAAADRPIFQPDGSVISYDSTLLLWRLGEDPIDLQNLIDDPSIKLVSLFGFNDRGEMLVSGVRDGMRVNMLLSEGGRGGVPEPMTWALLIVGFGCVGSVARGRRHIPELT